MIKIFAQEIADGIAERICSNDSVACISLAEVDVVPAAAGPLHIAVASANPNQKDLFYFKSVLVSTGWNNNDDVFLPYQLWLARSTPKDKQFNLMHNEKEIIGHMTGCYIQDSSGQIWENEEEISESNIPSDFDIIDHAVLYTSWTDDELQSQSDLRIQEIKDGKWFVSMECLFPSFDYSLKNDSNETKYITRDEATAYLSKHLRAYGGSGVYEGYKIGRVLKDLTFSGIGLVNKPANPKSLIIETSHTSTEDVQETETVECAEADLITIETLSGENDMPKELELELEGVKAKLVEAEATIASLTNFKTQAESLQVNVQDLQSQIASVKAELEGTKASLAQTAKARDEAEAKWQGFEKKMKDEKRKAALAEAGFEDEDLSDVSYLDTLSDEAFDKVVAAMKKKMAKKMKEDEEEETECKKAKCDEKEAEAQEISITVETEQTTASLNDIAEKPATLEASAADWFSKNVLKTSNK